MFSFSHGCCFRTNIQRTSDNKLSIRERSVKPPVSWRTCLETLSFGWRTLYCLQIMWSHLPSSGMEEVGDFWKLILSEKNELWICGGVALNETIPIGIFIESLFRPSQSKLKNAPMEVDERPVTISIWRNAFIAVCVKKLVQWTRSSKDRISNFRRKRTKNCCTIRKNCYWMEIVGSRKFRKILKWIFFIDKKISDNW